MDISTVTAALGGIKAATDIAKFIKDSGLSLEKADVKLKLAELISALADAKLEVVGLQQSLSDSELRIREAEEKLKVRAQLRWDEPLYWIDGQTGVKGPFCQRCYDKESALIRLQGDGAGHYQCMACTTQYVTHERRARNSKAIRDFKNRGRSSF